MFNYVKFWLKMIKKDQKVHRFDHFLVKKMHKRGKFFARIEYRVLRLGKGSISTGGPPIMQVGAGETNSNIERLKIQNHAG